MVDFRATMGGLEVRKVFGLGSESKRIGYVNQTGFFTSPEDLESFVVLSPAELKVIIERVEKIIRTGV